MGGGAEIDPLEPEEPGRQAPQATPEVAEGKTMGTGEANAKCYGAGEEAEPLAQQPSLESTPGASAAAAAAAGERLRESS